MIQIWAIPPVRLGLSGRNSGKTPETLSELFLEFPTQEYGWDPPSPMILKAFEASRAFPEFSPPQYSWERLLFQKWFRRVPLRAGHGIPSRTEGISEHLDFSWKDVFENMAGEVHMLACVSGKSTLWTNTGRD